MNIDTQPGFINYENVTISYRIYVFSFYYSYGKLRERWCVYVCVVTSEVVQ